MRHNSPVTQNEHAIGDGQSLHMIPHPDMPAEMLRDMRATIKAHADTARRASELAAQACELAVRSSQSVGPVARRMEDIQAATQRIGELVGVIDRISFQTHLLALNAAVEAARAGDHGHGFAAVAGEVRSLAELASESTRQIKALIADSEARVAAAAAALMADTSRSVTEASRIFRA